MNFLKYIFRDVCCTFKNHPETYFGLKSHPLPLPLPVPIDSYFKQSSSRSHHYHRLFYAKGSSPPPHNVVVSCIDLHDVCIHKNMPKNIQLQTIATMRVPNTFLSKYTLMHVNQITGDFRVSFGGCTHNLRHRYTCIHVYGICL